MSTNNVHHRRSCLWQFLIIEKIQKVAARQSPSKVASQKCTLTYQLMKMRLQLFCIHCFIPTWLEQRWKFFYICGMHSEGPRNVWKQWFLFLKFFNTPSPLNPHLPLFLQFSLQHTYVSWLFVIHWYSSSIARKISWEFQQWKYIFK